MSTSHTITQVKDVVHPPDMFDTAATCTVAAMQHAACMVLVMDTLACMLELHIISREPAVLGFDRRN